MILKFVAVYCRRSPPHIFLTLILIHSLIQSCSYKDIHLEAHAKNFKNECLNECISCNNQIDNNQIAEKLKKEGTCPIHVISLTSYQIAINLITIGL